MVAFHSWYVVHRRTSAARRGASGVSKLPCTINLLLSSAKITDVWPANALDLLWCGRSVMVLQSAVLIMLHVGPSCSYVQPAHSAPEQATAVLVLCVQSGVTRCHGRVAS
jgi:hypothetical protein